MFSFNNVTPLTEPMIAEVDGTQGIYLKKAEYTEPAGKTARIEFHLEKPTGAILQRQMVWINDYTVKGAYNDKQPQQELDRLFSLIQMYNPDRTRDDLIKEIGEQETWKDLCVKVLTLLPANYPEIKTSWFLRYKPGSDLMTLPNLPPFVKLGDARFKSNPTYDSFVPTKKDVVPSGLDEFSSTPSDLGGNDAALFDEPVGAGVSNDRPF